MAHRYLSTFPCTAAGARRARALLKEFAAPRLSLRDLEDFEHATGEALANVVQHSKSSTFALRYWSETGRVVVEIEDNGAGFLPPATIGLPPNGAPRGYGLYIMHELLDEIEFLDGGRRLRLVKRLR